VSYAPDGSSRGVAVGLDEADPLARYRDRFLIEDELVYLDGNSLGRLPEATVRRLAEEATGGWGRRLIRGWEERWMELPVSIGDQLASHVLGAGAGEVVVGDSTTVCFYKLATAALELRPGRTQIVTDVDNFPTDRYVLEGLARARGLELVWLHCDPHAGPTPEQVAAAVGPDTALVTFSHTAYRSAFVAEMAAISALAHAAGSLTLWDLSHSAGSVPLALDDDGADMAVGCTYKYLCAGPGAPAFMYARRELHERLGQPIWGWLGRRDPFEMGERYLAAPGIRGLLSGTPPALALSCVDEGVKLVADAGIAAIRDKGIALTDYAIALVDECLAGQGIGIGSPRDAARRGAHVALTHPDAARLCAELSKLDVITDFRAPDVIRFGLSPLSTRFADVWDGVEGLRRVLSGESGR
jgi:kynureninase